MTLLADIDPIALGNLFATLILAVLTGVYVHLTGRLVQASADPCVVVTVQMSPLHSGVLLLVVENIGKGLARDVRFELSSPIPRPARELGGGVAVKESEPMTSGPLIDGIPALAPGGKRVIPWGDYRSLEMSLGDRHVKIKVRFKKSVSMDALSDSECEPIECILEVKSFMHEYFLLDGAAICAHEVRELTNELRRIIKTEKPYQGQRESTLNVRVAEMPQNTAGE